MNNKNITALLTISLVLVSCSHPIQPEAEAQQPTDAFATDVPTTMPAPTATAESIETGFFRFIDQVWHPIYEDEMSAPVFLPEQMSGGDMDAMQLVQYGYFNAYDDENQVLTAYAKILPGEIYRLLNFQVPENQSVTCLPEKIGDTPIASLSYLPKNGSVSFPPGPGNQQFADFYTEMDDNVFMVLVLDAAVDGEIVNPIHQLAIICP